MMMHSFVIMAVALAIAVASASASDHSRATNLSLFRITPRKYTGVRDMNTGDPAGDTYFALYEMIFPLYCREDPSDSSCGARGALNNYSNDVYERSVVEVDTRWGVYSGCTPNATTGQFQCEAYLHNRSACWWQQHGPDGANFSDLAGVCSKSECHCPALADGAVGHYNKPMGQWPVTWHNQTDMWEHIEAMSDTLDGNWYVTRSGGECKGGEVVGDGTCFWRFHGVQQTIQADCLNDRLRKHVIAANPACWNKLPQPDNATTNGWSECLLATVTGRAIGSAAAPARGGMSREDLVAPFVGSFAPVGEGGCPPV